MTVRPNVAVGRVRLNRALIGCLAAASGAVAVSLPVESEAAQAVAARPTSAVAGYTWRGNVVSVSARWTVPAVRHGLGVAATSARVNGAGAAWFVQAGTIEERGRVAQSHAVVGAYYAFVNQPGDFNSLHAVQPGDTVSVRLVLRAGRSAAHVTDTRSNASWTVNGQDNTAAGTTAEWIQQRDPLPGTGPLPYPVIGPVRFSNISINGHTPLGQDLGPLRMSVNGSILAPDPVHGGQFEVG